MWTELELELRRINNGWLFLASGGAGARGAGVRVRWRVFNWEVIIGHRLWFWQIPIKPEYKHRPGVPESRVEEPGTDRAGSEHCWVWNRLRWYIRAPVGIPWRYDTPSGLRGAVTAAGDGGDAPGGTLRRCGGVHRQHRSFRDKQFS